MLNGWCPATRLKCVLFRCASKSDSPCPFLFLLLFFYWPQSESVRLWILFWRHWMFCRAFLWEITWTCALREEKQKNHSIIWRMVLMKKSSFWKLNFRNKKKVWLENVYLCYKEQVLYVELTGTCFPVIILLHHMQSSYLMKMEITMNIL